MKERPVKIAILDCGIAADRELFPSLKGASFIEDRGYVCKGDANWHTCLNSHGTEMAQLIKKKWIPSAPSMLLKPMLDMEREA